MNARARAFREGIEAFILRRKEAKLEANKKANKEDAGLDEKFEPEIWLADAALRAHHLKVATHPVKFTHSAIKGATSVYAPPVETQTRRDFISTHSVVHDFEDDAAIADAKHLDVYAFLRETIEEKRVLEWIQYEDKDFEAALSHDPEKAKQHVKAFQSVFKPDGGIASHTLAKQVYWLTGENPSNNQCFHLLQPMFSSSLEHAVYSTITSHKTKEIDARRRGDKNTFEAHATFPNLAMRKIGGANAQNVSYLNGKRMGRNYLLASLPPRWKSQGLKPFTQSLQIWKSFLFFGTVKDLVEELAEFLTKLASKDSNALKRLSPSEIARQRETLEQAIGAQLSSFAEWVSSNLGVGWTRDVDVDIALFEMCWLDAERAELVPENEADAEFQTHYHEGQWADKVADSFARWLAHELNRRNSNLILDNVASKHFARQAVLDVAWPIPLQRRAWTGDNP